MYLSLVSALACLLLSAGSVLPVQASGSDNYTRVRVAPKVFIVSMFEPEADVWQRRLPETGLGRLGQVRIRVPGLWMHFQHILCVQDRSICQVMTGMDQTNAATTMTALLFSDAFDLTKTYFIVSGIAGVNPRHGTLGSVAIAKYAVQVALQYHIDSREMPAEWETGYVGFGNRRPFERPTFEYGTEVMELNEDLRDYVFDLARNATLSDSTEANEYRQRYVLDANATFFAASQSPSIIKCDVATSDEWFSGRQLSSAFEETASVWTGGRARSCMTSQEDNATLEALLRAATEGSADFGRAIVMRAGANFDRPPPSVTAYEHLFAMEPQGFAIALDNLFNVGILVAKKILQDWDCKFKAGIKATNYIGDVFGSLGGHPDFLDRDSVVTRRRVAEKWQRESTTPARPV